MAFSTQQDKLDMAQSSSNSISRPNAHNVLVNGTHPLINCSFTLCIAVDMDIPEKHKLQSKTISLLVNYINQQMLQDQLVEDFFAFKKIRHLPLPPTRPSE